MGHGLRTNGQAYVQGLGRLRNIISTERDRGLTIGIARSDRHLLVRERQIIIVRSTIIGTRDGRRTGRDRGIRRGTGVQIGDYRLLRCVRVRVRVITILDIDPHRVGAGILRYRGSGRTEIKDRRRIIVRDRIGQVRRVRAMGGGAPVRIGSKTELDRLVRFVNIVMNDRHRECARCSTGSKSERARCE